MTPRAALAAGALLFAVLATANSAGYRYGVSDQAFYIPALARALDPSLFPRDAIVFDAQMRRWLGDDAARLFAPVFPMDGAAFAAVWYLATLFVTFGGAAALARRLGADGWTTTAALALLTLRHRIARTGANSLEGYAQPRTMAFAIGLVAMACLLGSRRRAAWLIAGVSFVVHPTTGLWFGAVLAGAALWERHPAVPRFLAWLTGAAIVTLVAVRFAVGQGLETMDGAWVAVLAEKDYLFPAQWPAYAWVVNLGYAAAILAILAHRTRSGAAVPGERALVAGLMTLVAIFLTSVPLTMVRVALAVQLQVNRVFWLLDAFLTIYLACWLASIVTRRFASRARMALAGVLLLISMARGFYVLRVEAGRPLAAWTLPDTAWTDALLWLREQPSDWHVLSDPNHVWTESVGVRLASFKDTPLDTSKDSAMAIYDRALARRVDEYGRALADFDSFTETDIRALDRRMDFDVFLDRSDRRFGFPVLFRRDDVTIYDLR